MDWLLATPQIYSVFSSLGSLMENTYVISPNAFAILDEINYKLTYEDQTLRTYRRAIGFGQNVREDLIPLLENAKDEAVLDSVIRILVNLTVPVECLFSVDVMYRTEVGRQTIYELNRLLYNSKEAFTDPKSTKSVVEFMKQILESDSKLSPQKCDQINNCLLLLRNILHIPEGNCGVIGPVVHASAGVAPVSMQNTILWNLFIQSIDKLLLYLMTCPQRAFWGVSMVQLIALMYKDQHVSTLQKLLSMWFEASLSDSSEDNESNTSPPKQGSGDSSPMLTSDPTSDSSDNGGGRCKNESCEDRRQALREETEATLQEVSRKGQAYQNSMLRVPAAYGAVQAAAADSTAHVIKLEAMESIDDEQCKSSHTTDIAPITNIKAEPSLYEATLTTNKQPAEAVNTTVASKLAATDAATFKSPTPLVGKTNTSAPTGKATVPPMGNLNADLSDEPLSKPCQKVPHSGQLTLAKGKCCPQKRECPSSQSELSDCGYGTQVENQESISTSSNDDDAPHNKPQHQKPPCSSKQRSKPRNGLTTVDTKELRRKKLVKRSKSSLINMKGLVQHTPTDEDISKILKEFTVDFLLKGYGHLVDELHTQLLANIKIPIDTSHFFWLVTYFLKFAAQLELDMEHINTVLTYDVISYLTYEGVMLCEQLELNSRQAGSDLKPYLRRMHLVVTAIREFLQAIETYKKVTHLSEEDQEHLRHLQKQISSTEDLRCLFVLLLRRFNPSLHTKQYLQDVVVTNHMLLLVLDSVKESDNNMNIKMTEHIAQFATPEVMHYYGLLLEDFDNNGEFVNDCIFTMMHHIGGDLGQIGTLFQPVILRTYSRIWEADYELCDDWSDLIEYVIHKFMNAPPKSPLNLPSASLTELTKEHNLENTVCKWSQEEMDTLYWYYVQSKKDNDTVGKIVTLFNNNGNKLKSRISIIQQLLQQDIITLIEYDDLMKFEDAEYQRTLVITPTPSTTESGIDIKTSPSCTKPTDDIQILRDLIVKQKMEKHLVLLQKLLLECCYVKTILKKNCRTVDHKNLEYIMEPVAYHCILKNKSIPVVEWNSEQATTMLYQPLVLLLHKLGFQLPVDAGSVFARIPDFWTIDTMFSLAKKLGPLDKLLIKFDVTELMDSAELVSGGPSRCLYQARTSLSSISSLDAENMELLRRKSSGDSGFATAYESDMKFEEASDRDRDSEIFAIPKTKHSNSIIRFTPDPESTFCSPNWLQLVMRSKCNIATITSSAIAVATTFGNDADICMSSNHALSTLMTAATATAIVTAAQAAATTSHLMTVAVAAATAATTTTTTAVTAATTQHPTTTLSCTSISNIIGSSQMKQHSVGSSNNNNNNMTTSAAVLSAQQQQQQLCNDDTAKKLLECNDSSSSGYYSRSLGGNLESEYSAMVASVYENEIANSDCASVASDLTRMYVSDEEERHGN